MTDINGSLIEKVLNDKFYWKKLAARIISESSQNQNQVREVDSSMAPSRLRLGEILENRLRPTRLSSPRGPGPRTVPSIAEVSTISASKGAVVISQKRARVLRRAWDEGKRRGQEQQNLDANPTTDAQADGSDNPTQDHPGQACGDAHPGMSHDDFKDQQEEEEHGPSPHIPGKPVGKVGGHAAGNAYDSPADKPAIPDEEGEEEEERRRPRLFDEGQTQRYEAISIKSSREAVELYKAHVRGILPIRKR